MHMYIHTHVHTYRELVARLRIEGKKLKLAQPSGKIKAILILLWRSFIVHVYIHVIFQRML